jgi:hypothetical protein
LPSNKRPSAKDLLESRFINDLESEKNNHEVQVQRAAAEKAGKRAHALNSPGGSLNADNPALAQASSLKKKHGSTIMEEEEEN